MTKVRFSEEARNLVMMISLSVLATRIAGGMCEGGSCLNTVMLVGRQLLKLPDFLVQARILVSPELVSSCANSHSSARSPSPYTTGKDMQNIPSKEYAAFSTRVICHVDAR